MNSMGATGRNLSISNKPTKLASLCKGSKTTGMSQTSRDSHKSAGHNLFLRNRENLVDLIVRKLRTKHVDKNPWFFTGPT